MLSISCYLLQTLLLLIILANFFVYDQQRTISIIIVSDSFFLFDHLFVDRIMSTTSFQFPIFYLVSSSTLLQTVISYPRSHSLVAYTTFIYYLWTILPILLLIFFLLLPQNEPFLTTYYRLLGLYPFQLLMAT